MADPNTPSPSVEPVPPDNSGPDEPKPSGRWNELSFLAPLLAIYTAGYMALLTADFLKIQAYTILDGMMPVYVALLGAYAADKEIRRWIGRPEPPRKGSVFVYLWLLLYLLMFVIANFRHEFVMPREMLPVVLQVLGIFFGSRASKTVFDRKTPAGPADESRIEIVMAMVAAGGTVASRQVVERLAISDRSARRLLEDMASRGLLKREGGGRSTVYTKAG